VAATFRGERGGDMGVHAGVDPMMVGFGPPDWEDAGCDRRTNRADKLMCPVAEQSTSPGALQVFLPERKRGVYDALAGHRFSDSRHVEASAGTAVLVQ